MVETLQGVDIFFIVMALAVVISTTIGALVGWHVFGIAREAHKVVQTMREEGEQVIHEVAVAAQEAVERRATLLAEQSVDRMKKPRGRGGKKLVSG